MSRFLEIDAEINENALILSTLISHLAPLVDWLNKRASVRQLQRVNSLCNVRKLNIDVFMIIESGNRIDDECGDKMIQEYLGSLTSYESALNKDKELKLKKRLLESHNNAARAQLFYIELDNQNFGATLH